MAEDVLNRIEKHMEGNTLALSAVAEVLQKMDDRFVTEESQAIAKEEQAHAVDERTAMVKAIASEVYGMIKADNGMDVDGTKVRSGTKMKGAGEDKETPVTPTTSIADQQATIQAAQDDEEEEEEKVEKTEDGAAEHPKEEEEEPKKGMYKGEDEEEEEDEKDPVKAMAKELDALKKQIANTEAGMQKAIQTESEQRLRKMGFREELGLQAPQMITPLGVDGSTPLVKSGVGQDTAEQLAGMSWKELRNLQAQIEMGDTEGVPRELLGG